jgi:PAS domain S-box-containing protein
MNGISYREARCKFYRMGGMSDYDPVLPMPTVDNEILRQLVEAVPDGFLVVNTQGQIMRVNARIEEMFGYTRFELAGRPVELLVPEDMRQGHLRDRRIYQHEPLPREMGHARDSNSLLGRRKDGSEFPVSVSLSPAETQHGIYIVAMVRDVTAQLELVSERNALAIELETEQERQRIGMDLHDGIMQEIYATALTLELALEDIAEPEVEGRKGVERAINQLHNTTRNIRSYIFDLRPRQFTGDLPSAIEDLAREFQQNSQINCGVGLGSNLPELDMETAVAFYQIVHEALSNIQKHARASFVQILLRRTSKAFWLEVIDNGVGFDTTAEVGQQHRGLRNMVTRCKNAGADLHFISAPGKGATIRIELPLAPSGAPRGASTQ